MCTAAAVMKLKELHALMQVGYSLELQQTCERCATWIGGHVLRSVRIHQALLLSLLPQDIEPFSRPKVQLEQYPTGADIASRMLYTVSRRCSSSCTCCGSCGPQPLSARVMRSA